MNRSTVKIISAAILGLVGLFLVNRHMQNQKRLMQEFYRPVEVLVSKTKIAKYSKLSGKYITTKLIPQNYTSDDMFTQNELASLLGKTVLRELGPGEIILRSSVKIGDDKRPKATDKSSAEKLVPFDKEYEFFKDFLEDGARVDVLLTQENSHGFKTTRTILQNIEVKKANDESKSYGSGEILGSNQNMFLVMSPLETEIYVHALQKGRLYFVIRNSGNRNRLAIPPVTDKNFASSIVPKSFPKSSPLEIISSAF